MFDLEDEKPVSFVFCWWVAILNRLALIIGWPLCLLTREHRFIYTNSSCPHMQILCQKPCITQQLHTGCPRWPLRIKALLPRLCACSDVKQAPNWKKKGFIFYVLTSLWQIDTDSLTQLSQERLSTIWKEYLVLTFWEHGIQITFEK